MISIHSVLKQINQTQELDGKQRVFSLKARYVSGSKKGQIMIKPKVSLHLSGKYHETKLHNKAKSLLVAKDNTEKAKVLLYDQIKQRTFTIYYWALVEYNGETVIHE